MSEFQYSSPKKSDYLKEKLSSMMKKLFWCLVTISLVFTFYWMTTTSMQYLHVEPFLRLNRSHDHQHQEFQIKFAQREPIGVDLLLEPWKAKKSCHAGNVTLLLLVNDKPDNKEMRNTIRKTWAANLPSSVAMLFSLGDNVDHSWLRWLKMENDEHGDLLVTNITEDYFHLPLEIYSMLHWTDTNCDNKCSMKTDSDVVVFIDNLLELCKQQSNVPKIIGRCWKGAKPFRDEKDRKLYIPKYVYSDKTYPTYCSGTGYLLTTKVPGKLVEQVPNRPWPKTWYRNTHEDVLYTGILAQLAGISRTAHPGFEYTRRTDYAGCDTKGRISTHGFQSAREIDAAWKTFKEQEKMNCTKSKTKSAKKP